jgi:hypothetical protein
LALVADRMPFAEKAWSNRGTAEGALAWFRKYQLGPMLEEMASLMALLPPLGPEAEEDDWGEIIGNQRQTSHVPRAIAELNARHFVVGVGGSTVVAREEQDGGLTLIRPQAFFDLYANRRRDGARLSVAREWFAHPDRRTYERMDMLPGEEPPPGVYNLWRGWGVVPEPGPWPTIERHLREVVCAGDGGLYAYLLGWLAHAVQRPRELPGVAVVMRGRKGSGKGMVAQLMGRIFGPHFVHVSHSRHLTGNFNALLKGRQLVFADEAYWAGDKREEGPLKALITEQWLVIEHKGVDPLTVRNTLRVMMATNNDWVVPASADERRYLVLDVGDARIGDRPYWHALAAAIDGVEAAHFLHALLRHDLSGFEVRDVPETAALADQKLLSAGSFDRFWYDCLRMGGVDGYLGPLPSALDDEDDQDDETEGVEDGVWPKVAGKKEFRKAYLRSAEAQGDRHPLNEARVSKRLAELSEGTLFKAGRARNERRRVQQYRFDSLERHREAFLRAMRIDPADHSWGDEDG